MKQENVTIAGERGAFGGYFAAPDQGPVPDELVVQEIFGVNPHIHSVVDRLAAVGYAVLAPDFFWQVQAASAQQAWQRTLDALATHLASDMECGCVSSR